MFQISVIIVFINTGAQKSHRYDHNRAHMRASTRRANMFERVPSGH